MSASAPAPIASVVPRDWPAGWRLIDRRASGPDAPLALPALALLGLSHEDGEAIREGARAEGLCAGEQLTFSDGMITVVAEISRSDSGLRYHVSASRHGRPLRPNRDLPKVREAFFAPGAELGRVFTSPAGVWHAITRVGEP